MNIVSVEILEWDSNFFGFNVAKIIFNGSDLTEIATTLISLKEQNIKLAYIFSNQIVRNIENPVEDFKIRLVDSKITLSADISSIDKSNYNSDINIIPYNKSTPSTKLYELAIHSGIYSRFRVDDKISTEKFESLYKLWIQNSVNKKIASEVLIAEHHQEIVGFISLTEKNGEAAIGLIAVDNKMKGKRIGSALVNACQWCFFKKSYSQVKVVTQIENTVAVKLYQRCNFKPEKIEYIYHAWL